VVPSQNEEVFRIFYLVGEEKTNRLERLLAPVDIVTKEKIVGFWWESPIFEKTKKIIILPVNITCSGIP
jgi:hypothetical protein